MANNLPQTFNFQDNQVRIIEKDGEPWFVAADVCNVLDLDNPTKALYGLDEDEQTLTKSKGIRRGNPNVNIISESGLYKLIMRSNKPEAKAFQNWVTQEVLPQIRKTGSYSLPATTTDNSQNVMVAYSLASSCAKAVSQAVFQTILADPDQDIHHCHYAISLTAGRSGNADTVHLQKIPDGSIVTSLETLATKILEPNGIRPSVKELVNLVKACVDRLSKMR